MLKFVRTVKETVDAVYMSKIPTVSLRNNLSVLSGIVFQKAMVVKRVESNGR